MPETLPLWLCCQLGAREHYAIPRALYQQGQLAHLITDAWVLPKSSLNLLPKSFLANLRERYHPDLSQASVHTFTGSLINFELVQRLHKTFGWEGIIARNHWFQKQAIKKLRQLTPQFKTPPILFSYSYSALELFRFAKQQGWFTILGQIDPGPLEEEIVIQEHKRCPQYHRKWQPAPPQYWQTWEKECELADRIVVNSHWSRQLLGKTGVDLEKIQVIPLVYTPPEVAKTFTRNYPESFSQKRPLRVLFLGQVILRKGIAAVLEAVEKLEEYPVEFWIVGAEQIKIPSHLQTHPQIHWVGHINRSETAHYYQLADVFLFPTLSDGFGLTQLEAQAWKLPIIASKFCGEVVKDKINGLVLSEVSGKLVADALSFFLKNPQKLSLFSQKSLCADAFSLSQLGKSLQALAESD